MHKKKELLKKEAESASEGKRYPASCLKCAAAGRLWPWLLLPLLGTVFAVWYIHAAAADVVYSDYIRLVDEYLPDVTNPEHFFVADLFTRIPASFLQRLLNVKLFGFSVTIDRLCTAAGLLLCALVLSFYARRMRLGWGWYAAIMTVLFSLNKWEILLNGTAWAHVVSFGLFFINYALFDRLWQEQQSACLTGQAETAADRKKRGKKVLALCLFPFLILQFAGEYIAAYAGIMLLASAWCLWGTFAARKKAAGSWRQARSAWLWRYARIFLCTLAALCVYLVSRHFAVWEHAGATSDSLSQVIAREPWFLPRFFVKTFAGAVLGQESIQNFYGQGQPLSDGVVLLLGVLVLGAYLLALILYLRYRLYQKTLFPLILLLSGGMNHVLVTLSRWIFVREDYALSSRYSAQFMIGLIGVLLIFGLCWRKLLTESAGNGESPAQRKGSEQSKEPEQSEEPEELNALEKLANPLSGLCRRLAVPAVLLLTILMLAGNGFTSWQEIRKAPYREANYEEMALMLRNPEQYTAEELCQRFDWHKDAAALYEAIDILRENHLNVFR